MKKTFLPRWLAMLLCLALLGTAALADEAEFVEAPRPGAGGVRAG